MWTKAGALLTLITALILRNSTTVFSSDVPNLDNVTVTCDSYGVVVNWKTSHPQERSKLTLKPNNGKAFQLNSTRVTQFNISEYLLDPGFNHYIVEVKTEDGKIKDSPIFSYNILSTANIICNLTFPAVELIPGDDQLTVKFRNPLHLYRDAPALRGLQEHDGLDFSISSSEKELSEDSECSKHSLQCSKEDMMCESTVSFPDKQEEYCVMLSGCIRQTYVQRTQPHCYRGTLKAAIPPTTYIIIASVLLGILLISVAMMFLAKKINKTIKENIRSNLPQFLKETSYTQPFTTLRPGSEVLERNPLVEPVIVIPITPDLPANSSQPLGSGGCLVDLGDDPGEEKSVCGEREAEAVQEVEEHEEEEVPGGGMAAGYDMPHVLVNRQEELSPDDMVNTYG